MIGVAVAADCVTDVSVAAGVIVTITASVAVVFDIIDVAIADISVVTSIAVESAVCVFVDVSVIGVDSKGRGRVINRVSVIIAVIARFVIDGGIGNSGLKWRGAARMRGTYGRSRISFAQEVAFASLALN